MAEEQAPARQYIKFTFFKIRPEWRLLPEDERRATKDAFLETLMQSGETIFTRTYSCVGMRADTDFLVWQAATSLDAIQEVIGRLMGTALGPYLEVSHSLLAMTRRSQYIDQ